VLTSIRLKNAYFVALDDRQAMTDNAILEKQVKRIRAQKFCPIILPTEPLLLILKTVL